MIGISILLCLVGTGVLGYLHLTQPTVSAIENKAKKTKKLDVEKSTPETKKPRVKSPEAKQAVVDADMETMSAYGLVYDYANKGLVEVVQDFLAESGIDPSQIAFTYRNAITGEQFAMNDLQPMTAGSTYPSLCLSRSIGWHGASAEAIQSLWSIPFTRSKDL